ncbi:hypothetical protein ABZZ01_34530, partial [Streptomyces virginiae]|uniref:hypothetical protein n=1 Tax=Streptomyces virginiae TaxID=1961 RepID=UPI0033AF04CA
MRRMVLLAAVTGLLAGVTVTGSPAYAAAPLLKSNLNGRCADVFMFHHSEGRADEVGVVGEVAVGD